MDRRCPEDGESIQLQFALSSTELLSVHSMTLLDNRSPLTFSSRHRRRDLRSSLQLMQPRAAFDGKTFSWHGIKAGLVSKSQRIFSEKTLQLITSCPSPYNLTTNQRAPRSQKWAGAEGTLQTAWSKGPILPGFSLNDPPAVGSTKQSPEAAAVVRGV